MKFDDVLVIKNGRNQKVVENPNGKYPIYGSGGVMGFADDYICESNTVVIGRKGSINNPIFVEEPFWNVDTAFGLIARREMLLPRYLYYFCRNYNFEQLNKTVTIPSLTKSDLLKIDITLPTLDIQQKIVDRLLKVEQIIRLRKHTLQKLDELVKARFVEMFGNVTNKVSLIDLCEFINGDRGKNYPSTNEFVNTGIPFINAGHLEQNKIFFENMNYLTEKKYDSLNSGKVERNDILYCLRGSLGKKALVTIDKGAIASSLVILRPNIKKISPMFLLYSLEQPYVIEQMKRVNNGSSQPNLSAQSVKNYKIILPTIESQNSFDIFIQQINKSKSAIQKSLDEAQLLFDSLMQKYFG